jgi:hypothetical protein
MIGKSIAGFVVVATLAATATVASAAGGAMGGVGAAGMGMGGVGAINMSGIGARAIGKVGGGSLGAIGGSMSNGLQFPFPTNEPEHYHAIKLVGNVAPDESGLAVDQQIVRLRVNGHTIPMTINPDVTSSALQFDQGDEQGQMLFRTIMSKQLVVIGDESLRDKITKAAAASPANSKPLMVEGFVYDRMTPYLVLRSVDDAP